MARWNGTSSPRPSCVMNILCQVVADVRIVNAISSRVILPLSRLLPDGAFASMSPSASIRAGV